MTVVLECLQDGIGSFSPGLGGLPPMAPDCLDDSVVLEPVEVGKIGQSKTLLQEGTSDHLKSACSFLPDHLFSPLIVYKDKDSNNRNFLPMSTEKLSDLERLKLVRQELGDISQAKLALELGIPKHKINGIEIGKVNFSVELAQLLEDKFNFNFKWLLTGQGEMYNAPSPCPPALNKELLKQVIESVEKILRATKRVPDTDKKAQVITLLYEMCSEKGYVDDELVGKIIRLL